MSIQLTALVVCHSVELTAKFAVCPNCVAVDHERGKCAIFSVQDFVNNPGIKKKKVFPDSDCYVGCCQCFCQLSVTALKSRRSDTLGYLPIRSSRIQSPCLRSCCFAKCHKKTWRGCWFYVDSVVLPVFDETAPRTTVRITDVVEVRDVCYVDGSHNRGLPSLGRTPVIVGKRK